MFAVVGVALLIASQCLEIPSEIDDSSPDLIIATISLAVFLFGAMWIFKLWTCTCINWKLIGHLQRITDHIGTER